MINSQNDIIKACANGDIEYIKWYISNGMSFDIINEMGWSPLNVAVENDQKEVVDILLENGADINFLSNGWSALHTAVDVSIDGTLQTEDCLGSEPIEMIQFLIDHGANINIKDMRDRTPLDLAKEYKSQRIMDILKCI